MSALITDIASYEVLDSRGNPTIEVCVKLENGITGNSLVPSGASTGKREAVELRDNDKSRYFGKGVLQAVQNIHSTIFPNIMGMSSLEQRTIDTLLCELDATDNKSKLGANTILGVSMAVAHAAANFLGIPLFQYLGGTFANILPVPMMNVLNGGAHANNNLDFQEFMIIPVKYDIFSESLRQGVEIFHTLKDLLNKKGLSTAVGDEGGFAPNLSSNEEAFEILMQAIEKAGYSPGNDTFIALDAASSEFYNQNKYHLTGDNKIFDAKSLVELYVFYTKKYPVISIEDGMSEDDNEGWSLLTDRLGDTVQLVGDDLFVTNKKILQEGIDKNLANSILVKVNQIGTLSETMDTVQLAHDNKYKTVMSHRSGETEDTTIADLAVAMSTRQIKTGSLSRTDRIAKYNRLLKIEHLLKEQAVYSGKATFSHLLK